MTCGNSSWYNEGDTYNENTESNYDGISIERGN